MEKCPVSALNYEFASHLRDVNTELQQFPVDAPKRIRIVHRSDAIEHASGKMISAIAGGTPIVRTLPMQISATNG
jgi:hypothetical protein